MEYSQLSDVVKKMGKNAGASTGNNGAGTPYHVTIRGVQGHPPLRFEGATQEEAAKKADDFLTANYPCEKNRAISELKGMAQRWP